MPSTVLTLLMSFVLLYHYPCNLADQHHTLADAHGLMQTKTLKDSSSYGGNAAAGTCAPVLHGALIHTVQDQKHTLRSAGPSLCSNVLSAGAAICSLHSCTSHVLHDPFMHTVQDQKHALGLTFPSTLFDYSVRLAVQYMLAVCTSK